MSSSKTTAQRAYCFTMYTEEAPIFNPEIHRYMIYQREKCPETGRLHWQGYAELLKPAKLAGFQKSIHPTEKMHVAARKGTRDQARDYCRKTDSRVADPVEQGRWIGGQGDRSDIHAAVEIMKTGGKRALAEEMPEMFIKYARGIDMLCKELRGNYVEPPPKSWHPWQQEILEMLNHRPDERKIHWYVDNTGNVGKSTFTKYLVTNRNALMLAGAKLADAAFAYDGQSIVIFDLPREAQEHLNYGLIEQVKNGMLFSGKYESGVKCFAKPHVLVFANFCADWSKWSGDRRDEHAIGRDLSCSCKRATPAEARGHGGNTSPRDIETAEPANSAETEQSLDYMSTQMGGYIVTGYEVK